MKLVITNKVGKEFTINVVQNGTYFYSEEFIRDEDRLELLSISVQNDDGTEIEFYRYPEILDYRWDFEKGYYIGFCITPEEKRQKQISDAIGYLEEIKEIFPSWTPGVAYTTGNRVQYNGLIYKVLQPHTSQNDWKPDVAVSLFAPMNGQEEPEGTLNIYPEWKQPTGSTDCYATGAKVSHNGKKWVSLVEGNVWEPSDVNSTLWKKEKEESTETETEAIPEWKQPTGSTDAYAKDAKVTYQGKIYKSIVDANVWAPNAYGWAEVTE